MHCQRNPPQRSETLKAWFSLNKKHDFVCNIKGPYLSYTYLSSSSFVFYNVFWVALSSVVDCEFSEQKPSTFDRVISSIRSRGTGNSVLNTRWISQSVSVCGERYVYNEKAHTKCFRDVTERQRGE